MANKTLNRPNNWQKQVNPNTKRMRQLMRDVRANVERRTRNSQDLDAWMENLSGYVGNNCFSTGIHTTDALDIVNQIAGVVDQTSLPAGSNAEILKGTMAEKCYTMVTNVGEDIKNELRQIAVNGYNDRLTPQQLAKEMGNKIESLDKARCQAIARTETCRAANIGNYINAREMGAKSYSVICNDGCCEYCQEVYGTDDAGGVGEVIFDIEDTDSLPPFHPNCRCTPVWSMDPPPGSEDETVDLEDEINNELTKEELDSFTFDQLAEYHDANYNGLMKFDADGKEYHVFEQSFDNGKTLTIRIEKGAVTSYKNGGVASPNEIIHEVFKVPEAYKKETNEVWFKNTQKGIMLSPNGKFDTIRSNCGGYNKVHTRSLRGETVRGKLFDDPNHRIVINPKSFKKVTKDMDKLMFRDKEGDVTSWKHIIHHEFTHSIDDSRKIWNKGLEKLSSRKEYIEIEKEKSYFTKYANTMTEESFAEHGGYVSYMLSNPKEQSKTITLHHYGRDENDRIKSFEEKITFKQYKQQYPKHYNYFVNLIAGGN